MVRMRMLVVLSVALFVAGSTRAAFDVTWDGPGQVDGSWFDTANWNSGQFIEDILTFKFNGSEFNSTAPNGNEGARNIGKGAVSFTIGNGSVVDYDADLLGYPDEEFRLGQGDRLTLTDGSIWRTDMNDSWENSYVTHLDASVINLDSGSIIRTGSVATDRRGGNGLVIGSWRANRTLGDGTGFITFGPFVNHPVYNADSDVDGDVDGADFLALQQQFPQPGVLELSKRAQRMYEFAFGMNPLEVKIDVNIAGGGSIQNEGEIWFGQDSGVFREVNADPDDPSAGSVFVPMELNVTMTIDGGSVVAVGGDVALMDEFQEFEQDGITPNEGLFIPGGDASIVFWDWNGLSNHIINFTGPGSIEVDAGGIKLIDISDLEDPTNPATTTVIDMTYEDLWDAGILQANGGNAGQFTDHFAVTGTWGSDGYVLTSLLPSVSSAASVVPEPCSALLVAFAAFAYAFLAAHRRTS